MIEEENKDKYFKIQVIKKKTKKKNLIQVHNMGNLTPTPI